MYIVVLDWALPLVYGVILLALALVAALQQRRLAAGLDGVLKFSFIELLVKDQIKYFIAYVFLPSSLIL